jgi:hypothetical protein
MHTPSKGTMRIRSGLASLLIVLATSLASSEISPARAQQPCTWVAPVFSHGGDGTPTLWTRVRITCNGGISQCAGRVIIKEWIWDAFYRTWVERTGTRQSQVCWAVCGETVTRGFTGPASDWPDPCIGCVETIFQRYDPVTLGYVTVGSDNFYFNNF